MTAFDWRLQWHLKRVSVFTVTLIFHVFGCWQENKLTLYVGWDE